eukprot:10058102-Lingulodinium_polyedra.AAC.1
MKPLILIHENVVAFGKALLEANIGKVYVIIRVLLNPIQCGWPISRPRQFCMCFRKDIFTAQ